LSISRTLADIFRQKRLGTADLAGGGGEALGLDHVDEGAHARQGVHAAPFVLGSETMARMSFIFRFGSSRRRRAEVMEISQNFH
jgi:hypothetical protein